MSDLTSVLSVFVIAALIFSLGAWLFVKMNLAASSDGSEQGGSGSPLGEAGMRASDWVNAAINFVSGALLGLVFVHMAQLVSMTYWPIAVLIPIIFGGMLLFDGLLDKLFNKIFPSGIRPASKSATRRRLPLLRRLSLPLGIFLGVVLALLHWAMS